MCTNEESPAEKSNTIKDPDSWTTGDEPATGAQLSYLKTLATEAKVDFDPDAPLNKAEASKRIEELRQSNSRIKDAQ